jgi:hypothetical protein
MQPDFDRAERHARELDGEDDSKRREAEAPKPRKGPTEQSPMDAVEHAVDEHKTAGVAGAVTGAATGTLIAGPPGTVIGAVTGAARGVLAGVALDHVSEKLAEGDDREQEPRSSS